MTNRQMAAFLAQHPEWTPVLRGLEVGCCIVVQVVGFNSPDKRFVPLTAVAAMLRSRPQAENYNKGA